MTSKLEYLKRYRNSSTGKKKSMQRKKSKSNFHVVDDDVKLKSNAEEILKCEDDPDDAPLVAELRDESVVKWQPLSILDVGALKSLEDSWALEHSALSPPRHSPQQYYDDLSPPRNIQKISPQGSVEVLKPHGSKAANLKNFMGDAKFAESEYPSSTRKKDHSDTVDASGKLAETIYRSSTKKKDHGVDEYFQKKNDEFVQWGKGVAQRRIALDQVHDEEYEMSKPLARFADDEDLERMLKACPRDGDPMLQFIKKKEKTSTVSIKKGKPRFKGNVTPNRFGIYPGYRWDGVNRSNGFEKAWISKASTNKAIHDESYKWSVEDM